MKDYCDRTAHRRSVAAKWRRLYGAEKHNQHNRIVFGKDIGGIREAILQITLSVHLSARYHILLAERQSTEFEVISGV